MFVPGNISQPGINIKIDLVSHEMLMTLNTINLAILAALVALFGIVSNVVNVVIFLKQGVSDTVNIGLLSVAVSDLCSLVTLEWLCLLRNPLFFDKVPLIVDEIQHLTAGWPNSCFGRIASWITAYLTLERCLCVVIPLKVKRLVTPKVTICVIVCLALVSLLALVPEYVSSYLDWKLVPEHNRSLLGLVFLPGRDAMSILCFNLSVGPQMASFAAVIVFTSVLVVTIQKRAKWRRSASHQERSDKKDIRLVKMIVLVAVSYCLFNLPTIVLIIVVSVVPGFIAFGDFNNSFLAAWSFAILIYAFHPSSNIFVYYNMSTKFRETFHLLLAHRIPGIKPEK